MKMKIFGNKFFSKKKKKQKDSPQKEIKTEALTYDWSGRNYPR